ncbi:hypothetical protein A4X13_0g8100 [Tilletia indica]|uniref:Protein kinase domain-containing protein n=1 Tax=Tilletia indica TaxID=43049 RepID=A0A8T8SG85_9BASI|nr:hypothetical protein A4X13_0g8100 [Tilletia indica]
MELISGQLDCRLMCHILNRYAKVNSFTVAMQRYIVQIVIPRLPESDLDLVAVEKSPGTTEKSDLETTDSKPCFETTLYDTLDKWWGWGVQMKRQDVDEMERPAEFFDMEQEAHRLIYELVIKQILAGPKPLDGGQIWARLQTNPESGEVEGIIDGDLFRDLLLPHLPSLKAGEYSSVPRLGLENLTYKGMHKTGVWHVDIDWPSRGPDELPTPKRAIFKSMVIYDVYKLEPFGLEAVAKMEGEAITLLNIPPHPHIVQPLALVVLHQDETSDSDDGSCKLLGWIMPEYPGDSCVFRHQFDLRWAVPYVQDLAEALRHCHHYGVYHGDVSEDNVLLDEQPPNCRAVLIDFERLNQFTRKYTTNPPEVQGHWDIALEEGALVYEEVPAGRRVDRQDFILKDLAAIPEALERIEVFAFGLTAAEILRLDLDHPWEEQMEKSGSSECAAEHEAGDNTDEEDSDSDDEEDEPVPEEVQTLLRRCCSYHPLERPLFRDIVKEMGSGSFTFARPFEAAVTRTTPINAI